MIDGRSPGIFFLSFQHKRFLSRTWLAAAWLHKFPMISICYNNLSHTRNNVLLLSPILFFKMLSKIKILLLECNAPDVEAIRCRLKKDKIEFEIKVVSTSDAYITALNSFLPNVILSNHQIEDLDALQALEIKNRERPKVPFILVTENVDELFAAKMMKKGAYDYFLKGNISGLGRVLKLAVQPSKIKPKEKKQENGLLQSSLARNEAFLNAIPDLIFVTNRLGDITDFRASKDTTPMVSPDFFLGKNTTEILPAHIASEILKNIRLVLDGNQVPVHEYQLLYPDGVHDFECRYAAINDKEVLSIVRDITDHKQADLKIVKSNRLYYFLSRFNQMIVYAGDEKKLLQEACKIAVDIGKFKMAWVGIINKDTLQLEPLVFEGEELGYLSEIKVIADNSLPEGQGPSGMATTQGLIFACNDIETDPKMIPWLLPALKRNYHSIVGIPIKKFGKIIGTFSLYSDTKNFFDEEEISLLEGATQNISFALENLEKEILQKKAEEEVLRSKKQFQGLVENLSGVHWVNNLDTRETLYISPSFETIWGRKCGDHLEMVSNFINTIHPDDRSRFVEAYKNIASKIKTNVTYRIVRPDGSVRWISENANVVAGNDGSLLEYGYAEDITEKKIIETELADSENRLKTILQNEPECVKLLDKDGCLVDMNPAGLAMIEADNFDMVKGKKVTDLIDEPYRKSFIELINNVFNGKDEQSEFSITGLKGSKRWLETHAVPFKNANGEIISLLAVTRDISIRKVAEENERQVTQKLLKGAEIANFGFVDWNLITKKIILSQQANEIYGIKEEQVTADEFVNEFIHPGDKKLVNKAIKLAFAGTKEYNVDHRIVRRDGSLRWVNTRAELSRNEAGKPARLFGTVLDITEQKNNELQIRTYNEQLRLLTGHLHSIREEERTRIGREIHDELGQQLTAIKMDVAWIYKNTTDKKEVISNKLKNIIELLDGSNQSVRRILTELRPATLDNFGLPEAMEWHSKQFTSSTNIPVEIIFSGPELKIPREIATNIFRIFQESLTNIMRYAKASKVFVSLCLADDIIKMCIEDDGIGFDTENVQGRVTFGILGMRERVRFLDGQFDITSFNEKGTKISISLPCK